MKDTKREDSIKEEKTFKPVDEEFDLICNSWLEAKAEVLEAQKELRKWDEAIYIAIAERREVKDDGTTSLKSKNFRASFSKSQNRKFDDESVSSFLQKEGNEIFDKLLKKSYSISKKDYDSLTEEQKKTISEVLTIADRRPSFEVIETKQNKRK